jgi:hypothetical protein
MVLEAYKNLKPSKCNQKLNMQIMANHNHQLEYTLFDYSSYTGNQSIFL